MLRKIVIVLTMMTSLGLMVAQSAQAEESEAFVAQKAQRK